MPSTTTPNMLLVVPTVGQELGPLYATEINSDLSLVDSHDHSPGKGVQVTPDGLAITSDLPFQSNNATQLRTTRFSVQSAVLSLGTDLNCLYDVNGDLYFNDGVGNQIRITSSGGVNGAIGNITNLVPPAALTYVSATPAFVATASPTVPADLDGGSLTVRENVANSKGVTFEAPSGLPADYSLTLPSTLPGSSKIVRFDNSGNISATLGVDDSTIGITGNNLLVKTGGIGNAQLAAGAAAANLGNASIPYNKIAPNVASVVTTATANIGGGASSIFSQAYTPSGSNGVRLQFMNGQVTITGDTISGYAYAQVEILKNGVGVYTAEVRFNLNTTSYTIPSGSIYYLDTAAVGGVSATYSANLYCVGTSVTNASTAITGKALIQELF